VGGGLCGSAPYIGPSVRSIGCRYIHSYVYVCIDPSGVHLVSKASDETDRPKSLKENVPILVAEFKVKIHIELHEDGACPSNSSSSSSSRSSSRRRRSSNSSSSSRSGRFVTCPNAKVDQLPTGIVLLLRGCICIRKIYVSRSRSILSCTRIVRAEYVYKEYICTVGASASA